MNCTEREVIELKEIERILTEAKVCRLALIDGDFPYIIPLCFGFDIDSDKLTLYFHTSEKGRKLDIIKENNNAAFEIDKLIEIVPGDIACRYSARYECITGQGTLEVINGIEKLTGLNHIMAKYSENTHEHKYSEQMLNNVVLLKLTVESFCCKAHRE